MPIKLGDTWVRCELDATGMAAIADQLDRSAAQPAGDVANWLHEYAQQPRVEAWPA